MVSIDRLHTQLILIQPKTISFLMKASLDMCQSLFKIDVHYSVQCTLYTVRTSLYTVQTGLYTVQKGLHTLYRRACTNLCYVNRMTTVKSRLCTPFLSLDRQQTIIQTHFSAVEVQTKTVKLKENKERRQRTFSFYLLLLQQI